MPEPDVFPETQPESVIATSAAPERPPLPAPEPPLPLPDPIFAATGLTLDFVPRRLSATLVNALLDYAVTLTNTGSITIELIALGGDMLGAHASRGEGQVAAAGDAPILHRVPRLAAGESVELTGTLRLPLAQILPITQGAAMLLVPLVRLSMRATGHGGEALTLADTFVVGEPPQAPGGGLRPFRLDLGPRIYAEVAARKVSAGG